MKLSVIIVNYNVQFFLEQTLLSVRRAAQRISTEVFVVDNNSVDNSVEMVRQKFPEVKLIVNKENVGFSKANNQAIKISSGEYVLLLNPDTVVREDTFEKTLAFMDIHLDAGGLGVKMIDGTSKFLPESKRGFPSPAVAFYKAFGFSKLFPKSKRFNRYYLGNLEENANHEIEVLSGAFMLMRQTVLDQVGYLDEAFFMYGEDIDLSYRIVKEGYKNYYFADTTIIHYKGESTKKGSLNYVKTFYNAMIIFVRKHFQGGSADSFVFLLKLAIYFRASLTLIADGVKRIARPLLEAGLIFGALYFLKEAWEVIQFNDPNYYDSQPELVYVNFPLYTLIWVGLIYLRGGYDKLARPRHLISGICLGSLLIAAVYGFLPVYLRASRMLIILGTMTTLLTLLSSRSLLNFVRRGSFSLAPDLSRNLVVVGDLEESKRVLNLLYQAQAPVNFIGTVAAPEQKHNLKDYLGSLNQLDEIVHIYKVNEIIFCAKDLSSEHIMSWMTRLGADLNYKIVPEHSDYIIGSSSKDTAGDDLYAIGISLRISHSIQKRNKRILDIGLSLLLLLGWPLFIWFMHNKWGLLLNIFSVILGKATWVAYAPVRQPLKNLPALVSGVLTPLDGLKFRPSEEYTIHRLNLFYAKDYTISNDLDIIFKNFRHLGKTKKE